MLNLSRLLLISSLVGLLTGCAQRMESSGKSQAFSLEACTAECAAFGMEVAVQESQAHGHCRCKSVSNAAV